MKLFTRETLKHSIKPIIIVNVSVLIKDINMFVV